MIFEKLGRRFHILLKERGLSQYKLSTMCPDLSMQTVYNATDGEKNTTLETIQYICDALEIPVEELFNWNEDVDMHLTAEEKGLVEFFRSVDEGRRKRLQGYIEALADEEIK